MGISRAKIKSELDRAKNLGEQKTISDSKREFHRAFSFVIPAIYRRVVEELIVELHLLSHQRKFNVDDMFAVGLTQTFDKFMVGYKPEIHLKRLFEAICKSNGFDPTSIRMQSNKALEGAKNIKLQEIKDCIKANVSETNRNPLEGLSVKAYTDNHYTRLSAIGIYNFLKANIENDKLNFNECSEIAQEIGEILGYGSPRIEKDLAQYNSNLEKLAQALEIMKEAIATEKNKGERKIITKTGEDETLESLSNPIEA